MKLFKLNKNLIFNTKRKTAFSLIEIVVAMGLFAIVAASLSMFSLDSYYASKNNNIRANAVLYVQEMSNALEQIKQSSWATIKTNTDGQQKKVLYSSNTYSIINGTNINNGITTYFTINTVNRDASGNIVTSGGTNDPHSRKVTFYATWTSVYGAPNNMSSVIYINDWSLASWKQDTATDFNSGTNSSTVVTSTNGGEVSLDIVLFSDWCNPLLNMTQFNISGSATTNAISAVQGEVSMGTGGSASGVTFLNVAVTDANPPTATQTGSVLSTTKTNALFRTSNYAFLATDTNGKEISIIQNLNSNPTEIGYYNAPGNGNGNAIFVNSTVTRGYMASGNTFNVFNIANPPTGAQTHLGSITAQGPIKEIKVVGNYAYLAINDTTTQMEIINVTNPASMTIVADVQLPSGTGPGTDINVKSDGTRTYLTTAYRAGKPSFYIFDTTNKSGPSFPMKYSPIGTYSTANGENIIGQYVVESDQRAVLVSDTTGASPIEQYTVLKISNDAPVRCGGKNISSGINNVAGVLWVSGNVYSYLATKDPNNEFKIVKGGLAQGNGQGAAYATSGTYTSSVYDTGVADPTYDWFSWTESKPAGTTLNLQLRASDNLSDFSSGSLPWYGPDGTSSTYYNTYTGAAVPSVLQNKRYFQYKADLAADIGRTYTPYLYSTKMTYQK